MTFEQWWQSVSLHPMMKPACAAAWEAASRQYVEGDAKDAARYRFLKSGHGNIVAISWNSFHSNIYATAKMGNVDAAIDAAMSTCEREQ